MSCIRLSEIIRNNLRLFGYLFGTGYAEEL